MARLFRIGENNDPRSNALGVGFLDPERNELRILDFAKFGKQFDPNVEQTVGTNFAAGLKEFERQHGSIADLDFFNISDTLSEGQFRAPGDERAIVASADLQDIVNFMGGQMPTASGLVGGGTIGPETGGTVQTAATSGNVTMTKTVNGELRTATVAPGDVASREAQGWTVTDSGGQTDQPLSPTATGPQGTSGSAFRDGLSEAQVQSIVNLVNNKPSSEWNQIDKDNWNFATNNAPLPLGQQGTFATLNGPGGEKRVVFTGSQEASQLISQGWSLTSGGGGTGADSTVISSDTMAKTPFDIGQSQVDNTFDADTLVGGLDAVIASGEESVKHWEDLIVAGVPTTPSSETLHELIASLDPDSQTGAGAMQLSEEERRGVQEKRDALNARVADLRRKSDEINALTQSYNLANQSEEGRPQTLSRLKGAQAQNYKMYLAQKNALTAEAGFIQSDILALQNQLSEAQNAADRAVDLLYKDREAKYNATIAKINLLRPQVEKEEQRYLNQLKLQLAREQDALAQAKHEQSQIQNIKLQAIEAGITNPNVLAAIGRATSLDQATQILGTNIPQATQVETPTTRTVGGDLYQWNPSTGGWNLAIKSPDDEKAPETRVLGRDLYQWNPDTKSWELTARGAFASGGGGSGATDEEKEIQKFREDAGNLLPKLESGEISWGAAFDQLKLKYPRATNETIDAALGGGIPYDPETGEFDTERAFGRAIAPEQ